MFWPLPNISNISSRNLKTRIDRHVIFTEWNLMFLITSQDFWQKLNISSRNLKNENWATCHIYRRKPYVFDHFHRFLTETEYFEQKSQKRELIGMTYLPKKTVCFCPLLKISGRNWTFRLQHGAASPWSLGQLRFKHNVSTEKRNSEIPSTGTCISCCRLYARFVFRNQNSNNYT